MAAFDVSFLRSCRMDAANDCASGGGACRGRGIGSPEFDSFARQSVDIWSDVGVFLVDVIAVDILPAEVISE